MCGHTEHRETRCSPPIIHWNGKPELCKKKPIYLQSTKNGICTQCRTKRLEASMARTNKVYAEKHHNNKGNRPSVPVPSRKEKPPHRSQVQIASQEELYTQKQNVQGAGDSSTPTKHTIGLNDFRCQLGLSHAGPCLRPKDQTGQSQQVSLPTAVKKISSGGGRTLAQLRGTADLAMRPVSCPPKDKIKAITGADHGRDEHDVALHGPRGLPGPHPVPNGNWNLIAVTKPTSMGRHDDRQVRLHGPREFPTAHRTIREDWNLMTVTNPLRRGNRKRLHLRGPQPIMSPIPQPTPKPMPAADSIGPGPRQRKPFESKPLIRQEISKPPHSTAREAQQNIGPDTIPPLPMSYKPILNGRHPLRRPLPPIPDESYPKEDADCRPPPVPPHLVLPRRKAIDAHAHNDLDLPTARYSPAPEAPTGAYHGREPFSGWKPPRCETAFSSFSGYHY
ncbi:hypothetical protein QBC45DRAFT_318314 [Copromyces sp. CBS 386.78]|nr:hypothetical protein QBC45DRAFT_318314 [Copromyces sp. CBS 386.78]